MNFEAPLTSLIWLTSIVSVIPDVHPFEVADPGTWRRHLFVVEAIDCYYVRNARRSRHSGVREGVYVHGFAACARGCDGVARGRRFAEYSVRFVRENSVATGWVWRFWCLMGIGYIVSTSFPPGIMIARRCLHLSCCIRLSRDGTGHDRRRFLRPCGRTTHSLCSELSTIEQLPGIREEYSQNFRIRPCIHRSQGIPRRKRRCGNTSRRLQSPCSSGLRWSARPR